MLGPQRVVVPRLSDEGDLAAQETFGNIWRHSGLSQLGDGVSRPGMVLNTRQWQDRPPPQRTMPPSVSRARVEHPWFIDESTGAAYLSAWWRCTVVLCCGDESRRTLCVMRISEHLHQVAEGLISVCLSLLLAAGVLRRSWLTGIASAPTSL